MRIQEKSTLHRTSNSKTTPHLMYDTAYEVVSIHFFFSHFYIWVCGCGCVSKATMYTYKVQSTMNGNCTAWETWKTRDSRALTHGGNACILASAAWVQSLKMPWSVCVISHHKEIELILWRRRVMLAFVFAMHVRRMHIYTSWKAFLSFILRQVATMSSHLIGIMIFCNYSLQSKTLARNTICTWYTMVVHWSTYGHFSLCWTHLNTYVIWAKCFKVIYYWVFTVLPLLPSSHTHTHSHSCEMNDAKSLSSQFGLTETTRFTSSIRYYSHQTVFSGRSIHIYIAQHIWATRKVSFRVTHRKKKYEKYQTDMRDSISR